MNRISLDAKRHCANRPNSMPGIFLAIMAMTFALLPLSPLAALPAFAAPEPDAANSSSESAIDSSNESETPPATDASSSAAAPHLSKIADPDTSATWKNMFSDPASEDGFRVSMQDVGRIWVDKSVYATSADAQAAGIVDPTLADPDLDFLVGLSVISSAAAIRTEQTAPHDVVFVISLNSTLGSYTYNGKPYGEYLATALNEAIGRLMDENSDDMGPAEPTRIAVIGYSIDATVLMPLDTYTPNDAGDYITFSKSVGGKPGFHIVATPDTSDTATTDGKFGGYAYLQRAIALAGDTLSDAGTQATADNPRAPELVVMGTEVATAANVNIAEPPVYKGEAQGDGGFLGSLPTGHNIGYGTDVALATLLTMQYEINRVNQTYAASDASLSLYTVGLDAQAMGQYVLQTAQEQANDEIEGTGEALGTNLCDNISEARAAYAQAAEAGEASVTLSLYSAGKGDLQTRDITFPNPMKSLLSPDNDYAFHGATEYFAATDAGALPDSFNAAVDRMLDIEYNSPVNFSPSASIDPAERFHIQDNLGPYMDVKRVSGIEFQGRLLDGSLAAAAVATSFADPWDIEAYHEVQYLMYSLNSRYSLGWGAYNLLYDAFTDGQIAYSNKTDFSNFAAWYVDDDHAMVPSDSQGYTFASKAELSAVESGHWREKADDDARTKIEAAQSAGATAVCQTYFYIGNLENQYTGADVPLYDFVVMVETNLKTGNQELLLSIPAQSIPALKCYITQRTDGSAAMELSDDAAQLSPIRLVFEVGPREDAAQIAQRVMAGEEVAPDEIKAALGDEAVDESGELRLYEAAFKGGGAEGITPESVMSTITASTNGYYSFLRDTPLFQLKPGQTVAEGAQPTADQLEPLTSTPQANSTYYYEDTYFETSGLTPDSSAPAHESTAYVPYTIGANADEISQYFAPDDSGQYCALAHTPKFGLSTLVEDYTKNPNATESAPFTKQLSLSDYTALGKPLLRARLGNNGVLELAYAPKDEPDVPDDPGEPDNPDNPEDPGDDNNPDVPDNPGEPDNPDTPDNPNQPSDPDQPDDPDTPDNPERPEDPGNPSHESNGTDNAASNDKTIAATNDLAAPLVTFSAIVTLVAGIVIAIAALKRTSSRK